jgi:hypothetical protein
MRPRAAVGQASPSFEAVPADPLVARCPTDALGPGRTGTVHPSPTTRSIRSWRPNRLSRAVRCATRASLRFGASTPRTVPGGSHLSTTPLRTTANPATHRPVRTARPRRPARTRLASCRSAGSSGSCRRWTQTSLTQRLAAWLRAAEASLRSLRQGPLQRPPRPVPRRVASGEQRCPGRQSR